MKMFTNKKIWQKIIIILVFIILFQFVVTRPVHAVDGGVLLEPVVTLFVSLADAVMSIIQEVIMQVRRRRRIIDKN